MAYHDILYNKRDGDATITINRPQVLNAFRAEAVDEMLLAMRDAEDDRDIGGLGFEALALYYDTAEAKEGTHAFLEKRPANFRRRRE